MVAKRTGLIFLSLWVVFLICASLYSSWTEPQAQGKLNLYQTNLMLETMEWQPQSEEQAKLKEQFIGKTALKDAQKQYQTVKVSVEKSLRNSPGVKGDTGNMAQAQAISPDPKTQALLDFLNLRLGILATQTESQTDAQTYWKELQTVPYTSAEHRTEIKTAEVLAGLWHQPQHIIVPDAQEHLTQHLSGWFRDQALTQLYELEHNEAALNRLESTRKSAAEMALSRLLVVVGFPAIGSVLGILLLIIWGIQSWKRRIVPRDVSQEASSTQTESALGIDIPWPVETVWATLLFWFLAFFGVSLVVPLLTQILGGTALLSSSRGQAVMALVNYTALIMAGLSILYFMTRPFLGSPKQWLLFKVRGKWPLWGMGGYCAALPLVLLISLVNHQLIGDQGGGNPLLDIILQSHDSLTLAILLGMVSLLAPFFEEIVFRGFALTSLSRYLPTWAAIASSAALFAIAHLNVADFLPLMILGCVLGTVYVQSRNLLSSMLLHSLWNGASFVGLIYLGSSQ